MLQIRSTGYIGYFVVFLLLQSILLSACGTSFHLREKVSLPTIYQKIQLENISLESDFSKTFENTLEEAGGQLIDENANEQSNNTAISKIYIENLREGKRVVAYTKERKARVYLVFLKLEYTVQKSNGHKQAKQRISLDKTFIYDANFALGKAEEEKQIREGLYAEAARLILLNLKYREKVQK